MTPATPAWSWAVTVTTPGGQPVPAIGFDTLTDFEEAREKASDFVTLLGEQTTYETDAQQVAHALQALPTPETAALAHSAYAGIYSAHVLPVAPGQTTQEAWEQHMPALFTNQLAKAWTWVVARVDDTDAQVVAGGGPFPTDRQNAETILLGALARIHHPDATTLADQWSSDTNTTDFRTHGLYTAALVEVTEGLAANAEDAVQDALTERYNHVAYH
ncbi:hypothetical protein ACFYNX_26440 [Streptomyces sp. NPDC007872]|uniref:hypothetical protein n=1 Tax=Streptomyces sp. NPDC007872 TaxID=3364782 RepID=UPI0036CA176C